MAVLVEVDSNVPKLQAGTFQLEHQHLGVCVVAKLPRCPCQASSSAAMNNAPPISTSVQEYCCFTNTKLLGSLGI